MAMYAANQLYAVPLAELFFYKDIGDQEVEN